MHPLRDIEEVIQPTRTCCFPFDPEMEASISFIRIEEGELERKAHHTLSRRDGTAREGLGKHTARDGPGPRRALRRAASGVGLEFGGVFVTTTT